MFQFHSIFFEKLIQVYTNLETFSQVLLLKTVVLMQSALNCGILEKHLGNQSK